MKPISSFTGPYRWLSNFYPCAVTLDRVTYGSVEHAYQAAKSFDLDFRDLVLNCSKPGNAKRLGKTAQLRPDWEEVRLEIMFELVEQKFSKVPFNAWLLSTNGQELIEGNHWGDIFWGVCKGVGENHLGRILMSVRERLMFGI